MTIETLDAPPTLGLLYGRALLTARSSGDTLPERTLRLDGTRIDTGSLADYEHVCGFDVGGDVPPTYPHMLVFGLQMRLMTDREFPLPAPGMVHLRNTITQRRAPAVGEPLRVDVHAERLRPHPKGAQVDLVSVVRSTDGTDDPAIWEERSTYFVRGATVPDDGTLEPDPSDPEPVVGARPHAVWSVPGDIGRRYAAVSGDVNPIHMNPLAARAFGMPGTIAHGMWTKAHLLAALAGRHRPAFVVDAVFRGPLRTPSRPLLFTAATTDGWDAVLRSSTGKDHVLLTLRER